MRIVVVIVACFLSAGVADATSPPVVGPSSTVRENAGVWQLGVDDGEFLIDTSITFGPAPNYQVKPAVAFDGTNYFVVWRHFSGSYSALCGARVSQQGELLDPYGLVITESASRYGHDLAFDGTNFVCVWGDNRLGETTDVYCARITPQGVVLDPDGIAVSTVAGSQCEPALAFDGENSLVVWRDSREGQYDIFCARLTPAGVVLDPDGIRLTPAFQRASQPAVAFDGTNHLVLWTGRESEWFDVFGIRVSPSGTVLDSAPIRVTSHDVHQYDPAVTSDGASFLAVWHEDADDPCVYAARISSQGVVLDTGGIRVAPVWGQHSDPAAVRCGANFMVAWYDASTYSDIRGARIAPDGTVLDSGGFAICDAEGAQGFPDMVFDGVNLFVSWSDGRSRVSDDVYATRVTPEAVVLDSAGLLLSMAATGQTGPAVASDGVDFLVVWEDYRDASGSDICGARVTSEGVVLDPAGFVISGRAGAQRSPAVAYDGANFLVVWTDTLGTALSHIRGTRVTPAGAVLDPDGFIVSQTPYERWEPRVASDGASSLVVWSEGVLPPPGPAIHGARVTREGVVLDTHGFAISPAVQYETHPRVVFGDSNYLVTWTGEYMVEGRVYGARVTPGGEVLDPDGFGIATGQYVQRSNCDLSYDGANFLVVWFDWWMQSSRFIRGTRVSRQGTLLEPANIDLSGDCQATGWAAAAFDGTNHIVVWVDGPAGSYDLRAAWASPAGVVVGDGLVVSQPGEQRSPTMAMGSQLLLAYQGWAGTVNGRTYNNSRIWGKLNPHPGVQEVQNSESPREKGEATIVRGCLLLSPSLRIAHNSLLTPDGRKVMELVPGSNNVSRLPPGVYFVRSASGMMRDASSVTKVVIAR